MKDLKKLDMQNKYKKQDKLAQKIFGIEYFNWLSFWEQYHLNQKYNLNLSI